MSRPTVGLVVREQGIDCAIVQRGFGGPRLTRHFSLQGEDDLAAALRTKMAELRLRPGPVHVGLPRRTVIVKTIDLPQVAGADLRRMVGFELERHLPFAPGDAVFGFEILEQVPGRPTRVLLVAAERRALDRVRQLVREIGAEPRLVDVTVHSVALVLSGSKPRREHTGHGVLRVLDEEIEIALARGGRLLASRAVPVAGEPPDRAAAIAQEIRRTLASVSAADRQAISTLTVLGPLPPGLDLPELTLRATPPGPLAAAPPGVAEALALALRRPSRVNAGLNLLPDELRPRPFPWPAALTAGLAGLALLVAGAIPVVTLARAERTLATLEKTITRMGPDVRRVEQLVASLEAARGEAETLRAFGAPGVPALPLLRELTDLLPPDAWLTSLTADRNGIELVGYAGAASQLIALLEGSPRLERAEFTSPVTKGGGDKEQFRLRAAWERSGAGGPGQTPTVRPGEEPRTRTSRPLPPPPARSPAPRRSP